jgi:hypothetical protein
MNESNLYLVPLLSAPFCSFYNHNLTSTDEPVCTESVFVLRSNVAFATGITEWNGMESQGREIGREARRDESRYFRIFTQVDLSIEPLCLFHPTEGTKTSANTWMTEQSRAERRLSESGMEMEAEK